MHSLLDSPAVPARSNVRVQPSLALQRDILKINQGHPDPTSVKAEINSGAFGIFFFFLESVLVRKKYFKRQRILIQGTVEL